MQVKAERSPEASVEVMQQQTIKVIQMGHGGQSIHVETRIGDWKSLCRAHMHGDDGLRD